MSLRIIKTGILDTVQDTGRYGFQHLGINPGGAMDRFSMQLANALLGKDLAAAVIEIHFPAPQILFEKKSIICITGADFSPVINDKNIPVCQPVAVNKNAVLEFKKIRYGARCYLSFFNDLKIEQWLNSYSTNIKAACGGWQGRTLQKDDVLPYQNGPGISKILGGKDFTILPWKTNRQQETCDGLKFIRGAEWNWLTDEAKEIFQHTSFQISHEADRMGYRLIGKVLKVKKEQQLVSSAVNFGTVQLLPNGQLIALMADHQTTGGYPKIAHIISAHLPLLAQKKPNEEIQFHLTDLNTAEQKMLLQQKYLQQLQNAATFKMEKLLNVVL